MDLDKIKRLAEPGSIIDKYSTDQLQNDEVKIGDGLANIVLSDGKIESNSPAPGNPGFKFTNKGSNIRQGAKLDLDGDFKRLYFKNGEQQLNPMGNTKASCTTDPLPTIVPTLRPELEMFMDKDFMSAFDKLKQLPL